MAQGLLILLVGAATRHQQALQGHEKTYEAVLRLGIQTDTGDAAGRVVREMPVPALDAEQVRAVLASFQGSHAQTPPAYSAIKVQGRPAYWWARRQHAVQLSARTIRLDTVTLLALGPETVRFRTHCSAGTYIRTLGESIADRLGTTGHLTQLVRLRIGEWGLQHATPLAWFQGASAQQVADQLRPVAGESSGRLRADQ